MWDAGGRAVSTRAPRRCAGSASAAASPGPISTARNNRSSHRPLGIPAQPQYPQQPQVPQQGMPASVSRPATSAARLCAGISAAATARDTSASHRSAVSPSAGPRRRPTGHTGSANRPRWDSTYTRHSATETASRWSPPDASPTRLSVGSSASSTVPTASAIPASPNHRSNKDSYRTEAQLHRRHSRVGRFSRCKAIRHSNRKPPVRAIRLVRPSRHRRLNLSRERPTRPPPATQQFQGYPAQGQQPAPQQPQASYPAQPVPQQPAPASPQAPTQPQAPARPQAPASHQPQQPQPTGASQPTPQPTAPAQPQNRRTPPSRPSATPQPPADSEAASDFIDSRQGETSGGARTAEPDTKGSSPEGRQAVDQQTYDRPPGHEVSQGRASQAGPATSLASQGRPPLRSLLGLFRQSHLFRDKARPAKNAPRSRRRGPYLPLHPGDACTHSPKTTAKRRWNGST